MVTGIIRIMAVLFMYTTLGPWFSLPVHAAETQPLETEQAAGTEEGTEGSSEEETTSSVRNPVRQDALTQEQIDEGWQLIGGYAFPPEALEGDAGIAAGGTGSFSNEDSLSNVTIDLELPVGQTEPFVLYFTNADTLQEYYVTLYASNDYQDIFKIPAGAYYFTGGGPENDYMSLYQVVSPESFVVEPGVDLYLHPVVTSRSEVLLAGSQQETETAEPETETAVEVETEVEEDDGGVPWQAYLAGAAALLALAGIISYAALKWQIIKEKN